MGRKLLLGVGALTLALAVTTGCGGGAERVRAQAERETRMASAAQGQELLDALDGVEARLYNGRAVVKLWSELSDRHKHVSALACENAEMHARGLEAAARHNANANEALGRRVAAAARSGVVTDAHVTGYKTTTSIGGATAAEPPTKTLP